MDLHDKHPVLVTCAPGIVPFLESELRALNFPVLQSMKLGVFTQGSLDDCILLNLSLRTAYRVLLRVGNGHAVTADNLYAHLSNIAWEDCIPADGYLSVTSSVQTKAIRDTRFANLKTKDAIVDRIKKMRGRRPDSGPDRSRTVVFLYWKDNKYSIFLDTSGEPLYRRGYRKHSVTAPMQETLAAAVLKAANWPNNGHFINPMCGSGTLGIEAALMALNRAPGLLRSNYSFMHIRHFNRTRYQEIRSELRKRSQPTLSSAQRIIMSDHNPNAVKAAQKNARTAGVEHLITFQTCDFTETEIPSGPGIIMLNPEYGVRMDLDSNLQKTYKRIGDFFKQKCTGYRGYIFTGNLELAKQVGLRARRRIIFYNGNIESRLLEYDIYEGSQRDNEQ